MIDFLKNNILRNSLLMYLIKLKHNIITLYKHKKIYIGNNCYIKNTKLGEYIYFKDNVEIINSEIGSYSYISWHSNIYNTKIGKFCSIGSYFKCGFGNHPTNFVSTNPVFYSINKQCGTTFSDKNYFEESKNIIIGNDVWIGADVMIFDGIKIGDGAIIAAGAIVNKDVPPYSIVGGVPAKLIKYRFDENTIKKLLDIKWWKKDEKWLKENFKIFHNINDFFNNTNKNNNGKNDNN